MDDFLSILSNNTWQACIARYWNELNMWWGIIAPAMIGVGIGGHSADIRPTAH